MFRLMSVIVVLVCLILTGCSQDTITQNTDDSQPMAVVYGSSDITQYLPKSPEILVMNSDETAKLAGGGFTVSGYYFRLSLEKHYLAGCINRNAWHLGVMLKTTPGEKMIFDGHYAVWSNGWWQSCAAIYESRTGWCRAWCSPTYQDILNGWRDAFVAMGVAAGVAWWLSTIITPVAVGCLGL